MENKQTLPTLPGVVTVRQGSTCSVHLNQCCGCSAGRCSFVCGFFPKPFVHTLTVTSSTLSKAKQFCNYPPHMYQSVIVSMPTPFHSWEPRPVPIQDNLTAQCCIRNRHRWSHVEMFLPPAACWWCVNADCCSLSF